MHQEWVPICQDRGPCPWLGKTPHALLLAKVSSREGHVVLNTMFCDNDQFTHSIILSLTCPTLVAGLKLIELVAPWMAVS